MNLRKIRGLKFPDEQLMRYFFKQGHHLKPGRVLELGCSNGNNLALFYQFGWHVVGVDVSAQCLDDARHNFAQLDTCGGSYEFIEHDLSHGLPGSIAPEFDCLSLANVIYYLERDAYTRVRHDLRPLLGKNASIYLRARTMRDFRYARGQQIGPHSYRLDFPETGEQGCINTFYDEREMADHLVEDLNVERASLHLFHAAFDNLMSGLVVYNDDVVIWGRTHG